MIIVPDTMVWIEWLAARRLPLRDAIEPRRIRLAAVVLMELWAGARGAGEAADLRALLDLAHRRGALVTPSAAAWIIAGQAVNAMARSRRTLGAARLRAMRNDVLLAATAVLHGATVLTRNARDFSAIAAVLPVRYAEPW